MFLELHPCESNPVFYLDLKGFLSMIIFKKIIFKKLFAPIALLLCFTLFKTGSVAKSIFGAH